MSSPEGIQTWFGPDGEIKQGTALEKAQFDAAFGLYGSDRAKGAKGAKADKAEADSSKGKDAESDVEKSESERLQATLKSAHEKGVPVVAVFASPSSKETAELLDTLSQNMKDGKANFIYADTDQLDPNSELGQVARRDEQSGRGLGADGKGESPFTGIYNVTQGTDGRYHIGDSVATFRGGRAEIASIMNDQLRYATYEPPFKRK